MNIEELKLILQTIEHVSDGAWWIAIAWLVLQFFKTLMLPVSLAVLGAAVLFTVRSLTGVYALFKAADVRGVFYSDKFDKLLDLVIAARGQGRKP